MSLNIFISKVKRPNCPEPGKAGSECFPSSVKATTVYSSLLGKNPGDILMTHLHLTHEIHL